jgi:hypothetical protein
MISISIFIEWYNGTQTLPGIFASLHNIFNAKPQRHLCNKSFEIRLTQLSFFAAPFSSVSGSGLAL